MDAEKWASTRHWSKLQLEVMEEWLSTMLESRVLINFELNDISDAFKHIEYVLCNWERNNSASKKACVGGD